jgi:hypothetical protein
MLTFISSTKCCLCGGWRRADAEVTEEYLHAGAEGLVVLIDAGPVCGPAAWPGAADADQDGRDDLVTEGKERGDGARGVRG